MKKLLTLILCLSAAILFAQTSGNSPYDPGAARKNLSNVDALQLKLGAGTAAAPAYTFSSDPDTGIYSAGANNLSLSLGATQSVLLSDKKYLFGTPTWDSVSNLIIDGSGNVNGTTITANNNVKDSRCAYRFTTADAAAGAKAGGIYFNPDVDANKTAMQFTANDATVDMTLTSGGNVLIATSTDDGANKLQVNGGASFTDRPIYTGGVDFRAYTSEIPSVADAAWLIATATAETYDISNSFNASTGVVTIAANGLYALDVRIMINAPSAAGYVYLQLVDDPVTKDVFSGTAYFPITVVSQPHISGLAYIPAGSYKFRVSQTSGSAQPIAVLEVLMTQLRRF